MSNYGEGGEDACERGDNMEMTLFIKKAELIWVKDVQSGLVQDRRFKEWRHQLQLFQDSEDIWRCGERLSNADISYGMKHPVVLPSGHYLTELIVWRAHERVYHNGVKETLTEICSRYWIVRGRAFVKKIISRCVVCRRAEGRSYDVPGPPPLPVFRVAEEPAFTFTGVDFAGPLYVKSSKCDLGGKVWVCVYTCCVTRAIHLDILSNMSLEFFIRSFKRFVARQELPRRVVSDNAKMFKAAARLFKEIMRHEEASRYLEENKIQWTFNVEKAPWWGGVFERLIRSVKRCLKVIGRAKFTREELLTVVTEIEMIINSRPLSYISQSDLDEPITPSHLLMGRRVLSLPDRLCYSEDQDEDFTVSPQILSRRMRYLSRTMDQFWSRWRLEYLLELREAHRYGESQLSAGRKVNVGDIVVVHGDEKRRGFWNMGRIEDVIIGTDGEIRGAVVRVYTRQKRSKLIHRPLQKLFPLEINEREGELLDKSASTQSLPQESEEVPQDDGESAEAIPVQEEAPRRSRRAAAVAVRDNILAQSLQ